MGRKTPQEIREYEFKQAPLGYSKDQVHQFQDDVAEELETLIRESNELHVENKEARLAIKTYKNVEEGLKETLLLAQKTAQDTLKNAQKEADNIIRKANTDKNALLHSAKEDLSQIQNDIRELISTRDSILIKLKHVLRSNLEVLDEVFTEKDKEEALLGTPTLKDERIVDFSQSDLVVEDLSQEDSEDETSEIQIDEPVTSPNE